MIHPFSPLAGSHQRDSRQQHRQLRRIDLQPTGITIRLQFFKRARFEQPVVQPESARRKVQQFHPVAATVEKDEQASFSRVGCKFVAHNSRQSVETLAHISRPGADEDLQGVTGEIQHDQPRAASTGDCSARSNNGKVAWELPSSSITIPLGNRIVTIAEVAGINSIA